MADKSIGDLNPVETLTNDDLFVLQQNNTAMSVNWRVFLAHLTAAADGHGGIDNIGKVRTSGTNPVIDTYRITYADGRYSEFEVKNGVKGDKGDQTYVWIKYSNVRPSTNAEMGDRPDNWMGINVGTNSTAPTSYGAYQWFEIKGATGATGTPARLETFTVMYQVGTSATAQPSGTWYTQVQTPNPGEYLWTRIQFRFNTGETNTAYSVSYRAFDGTGAGDMVTSAYDPGNAVANAGGIVAYIQEHSPTGSDSTPVMDGIATPGASSAYARADHVHPTDSTRAKTDMSNITDNSIGASKLKAGAIPVKKTINLGTAWTMNGDAYTQGCNVSGYTLTAKSKVDIQPDASVLKQMIADGVTALYVVNNNGTLTAYALDNAPTAPVEIQATVEEVL